MPGSKGAEEIIRMLQTKGFYAECPCCDEPISLKEAELFYLDDFTEKSSELYQARLMELKQIAEELKKRRKAISVKSEIGARAVNIGFILERIAPSMKAFPFKHNDCRSLFDPIDYLIFEGLSSTGAVTKIIFADIKTGSARLTNVQKDIKELIGKKKVSWDTYKPETKHDK